MKYLFLIFPLLLLISACNQAEKKEEKIVPPVADSSVVVVSPSGPPKPPDISINSPIVRKWTVKTYRSGAEKSVNFGRGEIVWTFKKNGILEITSTQTTGELPLKAAGKHLFFLKNKQVFISKTYYNFSIDADTLFVSKNIAAKQVRLRLLAF